MFKKGNHPNSKKYGYVRESWYVMSRHIGRPLKTPEVVHHLDGNKQHNIYKNLVLCKEPKEHNAVHTAMGYFVEGLIKNGEVKYDRKRRKFYFR